MPPDSRDFIGPIEQLEAEKSPILTMSLDILIKTRYAQSIGQLKIQFSTPAAATATPHAPLSSFSSFFIEHG